MSRRDPASRGAFSLLEVMIATAILAGSAMVLLSLINLGTRLGNRAEARISALVLAQSILDESIARVASDEATSGRSESSYSGALPGKPPKSYRVTVEPIPNDDDSGDWNNPEAPQLAEGPPMLASDSRRTEVLCVTVELFEGANPTPTNRDALVKLARWIRITAPQSGPASQANPASQPEIVPLSGGVR
jgi:type II secretory pathway pseudopilin PulG